MKDINLSGIEKIVDTVKNISGQLATLQQHVYDVKELNDHRITLINNAVAAMQHNLMIIKGATEKLG